MLQSYQNHAASGVHSPAEFVSHLGHKDTVPWAPQVESSCLPVQFLYTTVAINSQIGYYLFHQFG